MLPVIPVIFSNDDLQVFGFFSGLTSLFLIYNLNVSLFTQVFLLTSLYILGYCGYKFYTTEQLKARQVFEILSITTILFMIAPSQFNLVSKIIIAITYSAYSILILLLSLKCSNTCIIKNEKNINFVLYNKTKNGFGAYWVAHYWYFKTFNKIIPSRAFNGTIPQDINGKNVLVVDIDLNETQLLDLKRAKSVIVVGNNSTTYKTTNERGSMMVVWELFYNTPPPSLVLWINSSSSDLLTLSHFKLNKFNNMFYQSYYFQKIRGEIENKSKMMNCLKNKVYFSVNYIDNCEYIVGYLNSGFWKNELGMMMLNMYKFVDYVVIWSSDGTNTICSYRTNKDDVDVRKIARLNGGDGINQYKAGSKTITLPQNVFKINKNNKTIIEGKEYDTTDTNFKKIISQLNKPTIKYSIFG